MTRDSTRQEKLTEHKTRPEHEQEPQDTKKEDKTEPLTYKSEHNRSCFMGDKEKRQHKTEEKRPYKTTEAKRDNT